MTTPLLLFSLLSVGSVAHDSSMGALPGLYEPVICDHDHGPAPSFSTPLNGTVITADHGASAQLPCGILHLGHRAVSWIRQTNDDLQLLTVGEMSHTSDPRIEAEFIYPHMWPLKFNPALVNDSGVYLCHVATDPPLIRHVFFHVTVPEPIVQLMDGEGVQVSTDHYYRLGSTLELHCQVSRYWIKPNVFDWFRSGRPISLDLWRGGISIHTESTGPGELTSRLSIANASSGDGGNYTCVIDTFSASTFIQFLKEEKQAVIQQATSNQASSSSLLRPSHVGWPFLFILTQTLSSIIAKLDPYCANHSRACF